MVLAPYFSTAIFSENILLAGGRRFGRLRRRCAYGSPQAHISFFKTIIEHIVCLCSFFVSIYFSVFPVLGFETVVVKTGLLCIIVRNCVSSILSYCNSYAYKLKYIIYHLTSQSQWYFLYPYFNVVCSISCGTTIILSYYVRSIVRVVSALYSYLVCTSSTRNQYQQTFGLILQYRFNFVCEFVRVTFTLLCNHFAD